MTEHSEISRVAIIGGGLMGQGIAQVTAQSGFATTLIKASGRPPADTRNRIEASFDKAVTRGKCSPEDASSALKALVVTGERDALVDADIVIESVAENLSAKRGIFLDARERTRPHCLLASNTSTLRIADLAPRGDEHRTIGLHFFSPVPAMRLVELAYLASTPESAKKRATRFVEKLGKTPVPVLDSTGFIVNRLLVPYLLGAIVAFEQGLAPAPSIDTAMKLGCAHPVGPLMLCDLIGLDIVCSMATLLYRDFGDARFMPPALLRRLVQEGQIGKKSGMGFYDHSQRPAVANHAISLASRG